MVVCSPRNQQGVPSPHGAMRSCWRRHSRAIQSTCRSANDTPPAIGAPYGTVIRTTASAETRTT
jgi:hypothetical protein